MLHAQDIGVCLFKQDRMVAQTVKTQHCGEECRPSSEISTLWAVVLVHVRRKLRALSYAGNINKAAMNTYKLLYSALFYWPFHYRFSLVFLQSTHLHVINILKIVFACEDFWQWKIAANCKYEKLMISYCWHQLTYSALLYRWYPCYITSVFSTY